MSIEERAREVAESSCGAADCGTCARYIQTGDAVYRPTTRRKFMADLSRSYPEGIPLGLLPAWAEEADQ